LLLLCDGGIRSSTAAAAAAAAAAADAAATATCTHLSSRIAHVAEGFTQIKICDWPESSDLFAIRPFSKRAGGKVPVGE